MRVAALYIYPYKGGPAAAVDRVETTPRGFAHDRRFMVTTPSGGFLTQRTHPALGRARAVVGENGLFLSAEDLGEVVVEWPTHASTIDVQVWSDAVAALRTSDAADDFFTALVGEPAQLVYMPEHAHRPVDGHADLPLSFADGYPYLIANTASLDDLNVRIPGDPVPMAAFRPNIVVEGAHAWAEDEWTSVAVGDAVLTCTTNCERCSVTTLDPSYPDRPRRDGEPLRTLAKFRRNARGKVDFARNAILDRAGTITVGDFVRSTQVGST